MTYDPVDPDDDAVVESDVDNTSVTTDTINGTSKPFNLLRQAGYSSGDTFTVLTFDSGNNTDASTTSTTYTTLPTLFFLRSLRMDQHFPSNSTPVVGISFRFDPGTDENLDVRVRNTDASVTLLEQTGITSTGNQVFETTFTPANPDSTQRYGIQARTDPGTNSSALRDGYVYFGVQL